MRKVLYFLYYICAYWLGFMMVIMFTLLTYAFAKDILGISWLK